MLAAPFDYFLPNGSDDIKFCRFLVQLWLTRLSVHLVFSSCYHLSLIELPSLALTYSGFYTNNFIISSNPSLQCPYNFTTVCLFAGDVNRNPAPFVFAAACLGHVSSACSSLLQLSYAVVFNWRICDRGQVLQSTKIFDCVSVLPQKTWTNITSYDQLQRAAIRD